MGIETYPLEAARAHMCAMLDAALACIAAEASRLDICTRKPASYAEATGTSSIGFLQRQSHTGAGFAVSAPSDCEDGRKCVVMCSADGVTTKKGRPKFWALTGNGQLLATGVTKDAPELAPGMAFRLPPIECELSCAFGTDGN